MGNSYCEVLPSSVVRHRTLLVIVAHATLFGLALLAAFLLAYNFHFVHGAREARYYWFSDLYVPMLLLALPAKLFAFQWTGQHHGSWRYVGLRDIFGVIRAALLGTFLFITSYFLLENFWSLVAGERLIAKGVIHLRESSVFMLDWAATIVFVSASRILVRFYFEDVRPQRLGDTRRVLIVGAGNAGEAVLRELLRSSTDNFYCVGFLDDGVAQLRGRIHGAEIVGRTKDIRTICESRRVHDVFIALDDSTPRSIRRLVEACEGLGVRFRTIPAITDVISGRVQVTQLRQVEITDLLGREPVQLDTVEIARQLRGKRVLVTGAGGSIGSEMCRQIAQFQPERLILVERSENALFEIDRELRKGWPNLDAVACVADITDLARIKGVFSTELPTIVFHAAAHKHVPMMECNAGEAIKNNIGGTATIARACIAVDVEKMVMISTDKAVNPTSLMGCTKRVAEIFVQSLLGTANTQFVTVRFGNVLGSSGSVVPIFEQQIARGGPVQVTHPEMQRYFMSITEAAQLVLQAGAMGTGGEIYVLDMGEPVKILDLARDMITLSGLRPGLDIEIRYSGIRPGEKLFEELSNEHEDIGDTAHAKIGIWLHRPADAAQVQKVVKGLLDLADPASDAELKVMLKRIVPEYDPFTVEPLSTPASSPSVEFPKVP